MPSATQVFCPEVHDPDWQTSPLVQLFPSSQLVPFATATGAGQPVAGTQDPTV